MKEYYFGLLACAVIGCSDTEPKETSEIRMGATISRTGPSAVHTWGNSLELAAADATEGLALAGFPTESNIVFKAVIADSKNNAEVTVPRAIELAQEDGVKMILNGTSNDSLALNKLAYDDDDDNDLDVPIICVACSSPSHHNPDAKNEDKATQDAFRNVDGWHFGLSMSSLPQSQVLWNIIKDKTPKGNTPGDLNGDGVVKISTIAIDDAFGTGFQNALEEVALAGDPDLIYEKTTHPKNADVNQYDWDEAVGELINSSTGGTEDVEPDVLVEFTFPNFSLAIVKSYAQGDTQLPFLHTHSMRERTIILSAENLLDDHEGTSYLPSDGKSGEAFNKRFLDVFETKRQSQWDAHVYDGGILFALGALKATMGMDDPTEVKGAAIRDAMKELNDPKGAVIRVGPKEFAKAAELIAAGKPINYEGASGPCDFDEYGRALNRISHWRVNNGEASDIGVYDCVSDDSCPKVQ